MAADFWDTSALVKRYLAERGSAWVSRRIDENDVAISRLAAVEIASAFRRAHASLRDEVRVELYQRFLADALAFEVVELDIATLSVATDLLSARLPRSLSLRTLDAIQLASALAWFEAARARNIDPGSFVVADDRLLKAAVALELPVLNPEDHA